MTLIASVSAGSGKSILLYSVSRQSNVIGIYTVDIKHLRESRSALVAYYYFDFKDTAKRDIRGLLAPSLVTLLQLVDNSDRCWDLLLGYTRHAVMDKNGFKNYNFRIFQSKGFRHPIASKPRRSTTHATITFPWNRPMFFWRACQAVLVQLYENVDKERDRTSPQVFYAAEQLVNHAKFESVGPKI